MADRHIYEFGQFRLDPAEHLLLCDGAPVSITEKAFQVLLVLVRKSGHLVEKSELVTAVWGDTFIEEGNLTVTISMLRKTLGDDRHERRFIETIAKQGYRFLPHVNRVLTEVPEAEAPDRQDDPKIMLAEPTTVSTEIVLQPPAAATHSIEAYLGRGYVRGAVFLATCAAIIAIAIVQVQSRVHASRVADQAIHLIAIAPFDASSSDESALHLRTAIANGLIGELGRSDGFKVCAESAVMKYVGGGPCPMSIGSEQKVDAVLTGSVDTRLGVAHVTAKLSGSDGETIWTGSYSEPLARIQEVEDQIGTAVTRSVDVEHGRFLQPNQMSRNSDAYQLYMEGRYFWNKRTEDGFRRSIECYQRAILKDPAYAEAYAGLADSYSLLASYSVEPPAEAYPNAKAAAMKALQLNGDMSDAHTSLGIVALYYEWNWQRAGREFSRAIDLDPGHYSVHAWDSLYFSAMGDMPQAIQQARLAQKLDPLSLVANMDLGSVYYWNKQYDKAAGTFKHVIALDPYFARAHSRLGMVLIAQKDYAGAIHEFQESNRLYGPDPYIDGLIGYSQELLGNPKAARKQLESLTSRSHREYVPAFSVAVLYLGVGDHDHAMDWLERAYEDRSTYMIYAKVDPLLDSLRSDPRFVTLLKRMDFQELTPADGVALAANSTFTSGEVLR